MDGGVRSTGHKIDGGSESSKFEPPINPVIDPPLGPVTRRRPRLVCLTMNRGDEARLRVRRSFRVATAAAATSLLATSAEAFLCAPDAAASRLLYGTPRHRSSRCALQHSSSRSSSRASLHANNRDNSSRRSSSSSSSTSRRRQLPPSGGANLGVRRPRGLPPLRAAGSDQPGDAAASVGGAKGRQPGQAGVGTELAGGQPREGVQHKEGGRRPFGHITDDTLDLIRASTSITEVIGQ